MDKLTSKSKSKSIENPPYHYPQFDDMAALNAQVEFNTPLALARHAAIEFGDDTGKALIWLKSLDLKPGAWNLARNKVVNKRNDKAKNYPRKAKSVGEAIKDCLLFIWFPGREKVPIVHWQHTWVLPWLSREMMGLEGNRSQASSYQKSDLNFERKFDEFEKFRVQKDARQQSIAEANKKERVFKACNLDDFATQVKGHISVQDTTRTAKSSSDSCYSSEYEPSSPRNIKNPYLDLDLSSDEEEQVMARKSTRKFYDDDSDDDDDPLDYLPRDYKNKYLIDTDESDQEFEFWKKQKQSESDSTYNDLLGQLDNCESKLSGNKGLMSLLEDLLQDEVGKKNLAIDDSRRRRKKKRLPTDYDASINVRDSSRFDMFSDSSDEESSSDAEPSMLSPRRFAIETPMPLRKRREERGRAAKVHQPETQPKNRTGYELLTVKDLAILTPMVARRQPITEPKPVALPKSRSPTAARTPASSTETTNKPFKIKIRSKSRSRMTPKTPSPDLTKPIKTRNQPKFDKPPPETKQSYQDHLAQMQSKLKPRRPKNFDKTSSSKTEDNAQLELVVKNLSKLNRVRTKAPNTDVPEINQNKITAEVKAVTLKKTKKSSFANLEIDNKKTFERNAVKIDKFKLKKVNKVEVGKMRDGKRNKLDSLKSYFSSSKGKVDVLPELEE